MRTCQRICVYCMYTSVNLPAQSLIQYSVLFYKCLLLTVGIFSQVHLIPDSVAVQCSRLCWHNLPGNNGLMCSRICIEWEKHSPKSAVLYACSDACGAPSVFICPSQDTTISIILSTLSLTVATNYVEVHTFGIVACLLAFISNCAYLSLIYYVQSRFLCGFSVILWFELVKHVTETQQKCDKLIRLAGAVSCWKTEPFDISTLSCQSLFRKISK